MRIEVEISESLLTKEVWVFRAFEQTIVFISYAYMEKPKGKRKWIPLKEWDRNARQHHNTCKEPVLPENVKEMARQKLIDGITVKTWDEWKNS